MKRKWFIYSTLLLTLFLSCNNGMNITEKERGSLQLKTVKSYNSRSIHPDISMEIVSYDIKGTGPEGLIFEENKAPDGNFSKILEEGDWVVTVEAKNAENTVIYSGKTNCKINPGLTTSAEIVIRPIEGIGTLNLEIDWKSNILHTPVVISTLTPASGLTKNLNFTISGNKAVYSNNSIETGYHTLIVKLFDKSILTRGAVEVVRVVKDQVTTGSFIFDNINQQSGIIDINIIQNLSDPLDVHINNHIAQIAANESITLTASVPTYQENLTYVWYINGDVKGTGDNLNPSYIVSGLAKGFYRVDVTAFSTDGKRAGSTFCDLTVTDQVIQEQTLKPAGGQLHSLALKPDGTVWAWGKNTQGQLGDGTTVEKHRPVQVNGLTNIKDISTSYPYSLALKKDGTVWSWGFNQKGQLGDGTLTDRHIPVQITDLENIVLISAGYCHGTAVKSDGTVWAWGYNYYGQLGDGSNTDRLTPVQVKGLTNIVSISSEAHHNLAVSSDGKVWAWGNNRYGQLGDSTTENRNTPVQIPGLTSISSVSIASVHSLALKSDGTVWAWGYNGRGILGDGTTSERHSPVKVTGLSDCKAIIADEMHNLILKSDGTVWAWGSNVFGQLGDGTTIDKLTPIVIPGLSDISVISAGHVHSFASKADGTLWVWGDNSMGQLGIGTTADKLTPVQITDF